MAGLLCNQDLFLSQDEALGVFYAELKIKT
jgi:hypothetical protein